MTRQDDPVYPVPGEPGVFSTSLIFREGQTVPASILECMVAKRVAPGQWQVKMRSCSMGPNGSLITHPPKDKPVTVDGNTAYEMLKAHEAAHDVPEDRKGRTFEWASHYTKMEDIARRARLETAHKAHQTARKATALRQRRPR